MKKYVSYLVSSSISLFLLMGLVQPADAFSLKVPAFFKAALMRLQVNPSGGLAQFTGSTPPSDGTPPPGGSQPSGSQTPPPFSAQSYPPQGPSQYPFQPSQQMNQQQRDQTRGQQPCPIQASQSDQQQPCGPMQVQGQQNFQNQDLRAIKDGARQMNQDLGKFKRNMEDVQKNGVKPPQGVFDTAERVRMQTQKLQNAQKPEDLQGIDVNSLEQDMNSLDQSQKTTGNQARRIKDMQQGVQGMEQGIKQFEKQIAKLQKQNIAIPQETSDALQKVKSAITTVKASKDADEIENVMQSLPDMMQPLNDARQQLEMLSRWPQTLKQINQGLNQATKELARNKSIVDKLAKKGFDLTNTYNQLVAGVDQLKAARDAAVTKVAAGDAQGAFDTLESDFFDQMGEMGEKTRVIQTLSNLTRFVAESKKSLNAAKSSIAQLKRKKVDTTELQALLDEAQAKSDEVAVLVESTDLDEDAVMAGIQDYQDLMQQFDSMREDLGGGMARPWQSGGQQFNEISIPSVFGSPQKKGQPASVLGNGVATGQQ
ncbi:MAG: hypothetical protein HZA35_02330 [Parcubacteria group bacterium]|nr:hypothetical protein [Parcubacteria group bacterium]